MKLSLPPSVTIADAEALHALLLEAVHDSGPLEVDASGVTQVDTAGLQLLCALARDRRRASLPLVWQGRHTLDPSLTAAGLNDELEAQENDDGADSGS